MKKLILLILLNLNAFAQTDFTIHHFDDDPFLSYDTTGQYSRSDFYTLISPVAFNDSIVKHQLDSINQYTPLDLIYNKTIGQYIKYYLFQKPEQVAKLLTLSNYYFPIFEEYLDKNNLPLELKYLPIIESALNPNSKSPMGATGIWQFMYYTAKEYGLRINSYLDERKDVYKSTAAACSYLEKSFQTFKNWELAIASYNCGRGNVTKAIRRSGGRINYWDIRPFLPRETKNYIPSLIAAIYVMNFAEYYSIYPNEDISMNIYSIDTVFLKKPAKISHLANLLNIDVNLLEKLNPVYTSKLVPRIESEKFPVILPDYKWGVFLNNEDSIYSELERLEHLENLEYPEFTNIEKIKYRVKSGDYLGKIARNYNCKVSDIMRWNDLKTTRIKQGKTLYIYNTIK